jgi:hypothetical protein
MLVYDNDMNLKHLMRKFSTNIDLPEVFCDRFNQTMYLNFSFPNSYWEFDEFVE